jgi:hypothetical protein
VASLEGQLIHGVMSEEAKVWVQLYIGNTKSGDVFKARVGAKEDIDDLKTVVYQARHTSLGHCDAAHLDVYKAGTKLSPKEEVPLDPDEILRVVAPDTSNQHGT